MIVYIYTFQNHNCFENGPPEVGSHVQVRWIDGALYYGNFKGTNSHTLYVVSAIDTFHLIILLL